MTSKEEEVRISIVRALQNGANPKEIIATFGFSKPTVYRISKKFSDYVKEGGDPDSFRKKRPSKNDMGRLSDPDKVELVIDLVHEDPGRSMREIARITGLSNRTVRRVIHEDLYYRSYVLKRAQTLSQNTISSRLSRSQNLLLIMKKKHPVIFFSDEKVFTIEQNVNRRNHRWLCSDTSEVPIVEHSHHPQSVMVLGVISSQGHVMPPHFIERGIRLNGESYRDILRDIVIPWCRQVSQGAGFIFQQDGAPPHTSELAQNWLRDNLSGSEKWWPKSMWPPCSPDLSPLDYFLWSYLEARVNRTAHANVNDLKVKIEAEMAGLKEAVVTKACRKFRVRLQACVAAKGGHFEMYL